MYLNCHSYYSLRYGTIPVEEIPAQVYRLGGSFAALTDINCTTGVFDFVRACQAQGIKPLVGAEIKQGDQTLYICIAKNLNGFREINELITQVNLKERVLPLQSPFFQDVFVIYPTSNIPPILQPNEWIGIRSEEIKRFKHPVLKNLNQVVLLQSLTFRNAKELELHQLLRCVDHNVLLSHLKPDQMAGSTHLPLTVEAIGSGLQHHSEILNSTQRLADQCFFDFDFQAPKNKKHYTGSQYEDRVLLETLALEGFRDRYAADDQVAKKRLHEELAIIDKLAFSCYFLITWDVVRYSLHNGYFHVGRGSGANSIVAYCLKITEVDPIELNLYFSRFLNTKRSSPPDFDIDWSWKDRDDIIAYIFKRFGREHTGFCGTVTDFKYRSVVRELGKVFGLPKEELDRLSRKSFQEQDVHEISQKIHHFGEMLKGFPNQYSMHSCGIFISEAPISTYTTMNIYPKGVPTCEIDMYIAESIKLEKLDVLSQRGLGHIKDAVQMVATNQGIQLDITKTEAFKKDEKCNEMLATGKTLGCFYIESPAMRGLLRRLKCNDYEVLVAASSIIRPGVAQSGMMREYVERHRDPSKIRYFHPVFEEQLSDTYGVMVYQEDVIKIAHHFAKMGLDEADVLRRGMSGKSRSKEEIERIKEMFFENCRAQGYSDVVTNEVYRQIASFAGYSFCKSHSASYAVESYQSLYLKAYYPLEFITAVINNNGGFYRPEVYINEARKLGATIEPPRINFSEELTSLSGNTIFIGFNQVSHLSNQSAKRIEKERKASGPYHSVKELIDRTQITYDEICQLAYVGAFKSWGIPKGQIIVEAKRLTNQEPVQPTAKSDKLFELPQKDFSFPTMAIDPFEDAFDEIESLGYPVTVSAFDLLKTKYRGDVWVKDLLKNINRVVRMVGYLVSIKDVPIKRKEGTVKMNFGTWIDSNGDYFDTTHFPPSLKQYPFKGLGCYLLLGKVVVDFDFPSIEILKMDRLPMVPDPRFSEVDQPNHETWDKLKVAHSFTSRDPYPSKQELDELYGRKPVSGDYDFQRSGAVKMQLGGRKG